MQSCFTGKICQTVPNGLAAVQFDWIGASVTANAPNNSGNFFLTLRMSDSLSRRMSGPDTIRCANLLALFVYEERCLRELEQVAAVTSESNEFLKRKFVSSAEWKLVKHPMSDCFDTHHEEELPIART